MIQQALERVRAELRAVEASLARAHASLSQVAAAAEASPQAGPDRRKLSRVWSPERDALLDAEYGLGDHPRLLARLNALPHHAPVRSIGAMIQRACARGLRIAPAVKAATRRDVGRRVALLRRGVPSPNAATPITWVGRRAELLLEYPTVPSLSELLDRINAEPGPVVTGKAMRAAALKRGLKRDKQAMRRAISEARRARAPRAAAVEPPPAPVVPVVPVVPPAPVAPVSAHEQQRERVRRALEKGVSDWAMWAAQQRMHLREVYRIKGEIMRESER
jgi:HEPN domain-containing protein